MQYCIRGGGFVMHELGLVLGAGLVTWILCSPTAWLLRYGGFWISPTSDPVMMLRHSEGRVAPLAVIFLTVCFGFIRAELL